MRPNSASRSLSIGWGSKEPTREEKFYGNVFLKHLEVLKYLPVLTTIAPKLTLKFSKKICNSSTVKWSLSRTRKKKLQTLYITTIWVVQNDHSLKRGNSAWFMTSIEFYFSFTKLYIPTCSKTLWQSETEVSPIVLILHNCITYYMTLLWWMGGWVDYKK